MPTSPDSFDALLKTKTEDLRPELQLPAGTWHFRCRAVSPKENSEGQPYLVLALQPIEAQADVDPDRLAEWQLDGDEDAVVFHAIRGGKRAIEAQLKRICEAVDAKSPADLVTADFYAHLTYEPNKNDPDRPWARVSSFSSF